MKKISLTIILLFSCLAVISIGFAAWIVAGAGTINTATGEFVVDSVETGNGYTINASVDGLIHFGAKKDYSNPNAWLTNDSTEKENLIVTLNVEIDKANLFNENLKIVITPSNKDSWQELVDAKYISDVPKDLVITNAELVDDGKASMEITFSWGEYFTLEEKIVNPIEYYNAKTRTDELASEAITVLNTIKNKLSNMTYTVTLVPVDNSN